MRAVAHIAAAESVFADVCPSPPQPVCEHVSINSQTSARMTCPSDSSEHLPIKRSKQLPIDRSKHQSWINSAVHTDRIWIWVNRIQVHGIWVVQTHVFVRRGLCYRQVRASSTGVGGQQTHKKAMEAGVCGSWHHVRWTHLNIIVAVCWIRLDIVIGVCRSHLGIY